jgi:hypothetical protein
MVGKVDLSLNWILPTILKELNPKKSMTRRRGVEYCS